MNVAFDAAPTEYRVVVFRGIAMILTIRKFDFAFQNQVATDTPFSHEFRNAMPGAKELMADLGTAFMQSAHRHADQPAFISDDRTLALLPFCHAFGNSVLQSHLLAENPAVFYIRSRLTGIAIKRIQEKLPASTLQVDRER